MYEALQQSFAGFSTEKVATVVVVVVCGPPIKNETQWPSSDNTQLEHGLKKTSFSKSMGEEKFIIADPVYYDTHGVWEGKERV